MASAKDALTSYSFRIKASSREHAKAMVAAKLDEVAAQHPAHRNGREPAMSTAGSHIDLCDEPGDGQEMTVAMQGTLTWRPGDTEHQVIGVGLRIAVGTFAKQPEQAQ